MITRKVSLVQGGAGLLVISPITPAEKLPGAENISGFTLGVIRLDALIDAASVGQDLTGIQYWLIDETPLASNEVMISNAASPPSAFEQNEPGIFGSQSAIGTRHKIDVGGRQWSLFFAPTPAFFAHHRQQSSWFVLLGGLLATSFVSAFVLLLTGREGELLHVVSTQTAKLEDNIQALTASQNQLSSTATRYSSLMKSASDGIYILDRTGLLVEANDAFLHMHGLTEAAIGNLRVWNWNTDMSPQELGGHLQQSFDQSQVQILETRHVNTDGSEFDVEVCSRNIRLEGVPYLYCSVRNISNRKQIERQLIESETNYRSLVEYQIEFVVRLDDCGRFIFVNTAFAKAVGEPPSQIIGKDWRQFIHPDDLMSTVQAIQDALTGPEYYASVESRLRYHDGYRYVMWEGKAIVNSQGTPELQAVGRDITERKYAEDKIRQNEHFLSESQRIGRVGSWQYALNGDLVWSAETYRIFQVPAETFTPTVDTWFDLIHPDDRNALQDWFDQCFNGWDMSPLEFRICGQDRTLRHLLVFGELQLDPQKRPDKMVGVVQDVTELIETTELLIKSEERFRTLVEGITDWIWETDENHCFTWFSPSFETIVKRSTELLLGKRRWDIASPEQEIDASLWQAHIKTLGHHTPFRDFRYWINAQDGTPVWISISGTPRFDSDGQFLGYRGSGTDVTNEAITAMRLKMLSTVIEQAPISVIITNPQGIIEYVNPQYSAIYGYSSAEAIGQTPRLHSSPETGEDIHRDMWVRIKSGERWMGEVRNRRKDGELRWVSLIISPVNDDVGHIMHYVAIMDDITERHALQEKLHHTNAELEQFAYVASHDLRQPLRMVASYLSLIEKSLKDTLTDDTRTHLNYAVNGAKRMDRMIVDLLEYSRTGRATDSEQLDLNEVINEAILNLSISIQNAKAEISIAPEFPMANGNSSELVRLFQNLIGNAIKYCAPDRQIKIEIGWRRRGLNNLLWVKDNGIGIAHQDWERAFLIFQRLVAKDAYEGTGIGLAVCKKIVEHHGGKIWIESELGQGSTFFITLPALAQFQEEGQLNKSVIAV